MNLQDYRRHYADLYNKIETAKQEFTGELTATRETFDKLYRQQQEIDKRWFVANLDFFLKHKARFQSSSGLGEIIIDFFTLDYFAGLVGGFGFCSGRECKVYLKDLLRLWDEGFTYRGYPIVGYESYTHHGRKIIISYIKNGRIEVASTGYLTGQNPLELPKEITEKVKKVDVSNKYPHWQTYKTIDVVRNVLDQSG